MRSRPWVRASSPCRRRRRGATRSPRKSRERTDVEHVSARADLGRDELEQRALAVVRHEVTDARVDAHGLIVDAPRHPGAPVPRPKRTCVDSAGEAIGTGSRAATRTRPSSCGPDERRAANVVADALQGREQVRISRPERGAIDHERRANHDQWGAVGVGIQSPARLRGRQRPARGSTRHAPLRRARRAG